jgi:hypothetical protein
LISAQFMTGISQNPNPPPAVNMKQTTARIPNIFFKEFIVYLLCAIAK